MRGHSKEKDKAYSKGHSKTYGKEQGKEQNKAYSKEYGGEQASSQSGNSSGNLSGNSSGNLSNKRILFFVKKGEIFLHEHRHILLALQGAGAEVSIIAQKASEPRKLKTKVNTKTNTKAKTTANTTAKTPDLATLNLPISELDFSDHGINPLAELRTLRQALRVFRERRPHIVIAYTIKPILYSALANRLLKLPRLLDFKDLGKKALNKETLNKEAWTKSFRLIAFFTGLGRAFMSRSIFHRALSSLLCLLLRDATQLWVLNEHNRDLLRDRLPPRLAERVLLSNDMGIDLTRFQSKDKGKDKDKSKREQPSTIRFLFLSRLLRAKGVGEYLEAAKLLRDNNHGDKNQSDENKLGSSQSGVSLEFLLAGDYAPNDPDSFPLALIERAHKHGEIRWLEQGGESEQVGKQMGKQAGRQASSRQASSRQADRQAGKQADRQADKQAGIKREDIASLLETVDCLVLPTYYAEGLPRVILEAAAMGVPSIVARYAGWQRVVAGADSAASSSTPAITPATTSAITSAITCACRDSEDLARALLHFSKLPFHERRSMGLVAREYVTLHFSQEIACDFYLSSLASAAAEIKAGVKGGVKN